jgi:hypothetical protein
MGWVGGKMQARWKNALKKKPLQVDLSGDVKTLKFDDVLANQRVPMSCQSEAFEEFCEQPLS